jgi:pimeloyl-ACP methyl ester carboxylesterase
MPIGDALDFRQTPVPVLEILPVVAIVDHGVTRLGEGLAACLPTLVMRGSESDVFHPEDAESLTARLPHGRQVTIPRAGHTVQGDNPKDLVAELRRFLAGDN